jgi:NTP pyrophosphatase (non-canonical NTP hydrolase)
MKGYPMPTSIETAYADFVKLRFKAETPDTLHVGALLHAAVGIAGEAGELLDAVKKTWVYERPLDIANLVEELGDLEFYMQAMRAELGITREQVLEANVQKLLKRYPTGYTNEAAIARADKV